MANIPQTILEDEGRRLRAAYKRLKLTKRITQSEIAANCGWRNASTFSRLLSGKQALTLESLTKLAPVLGVPPAAISPRLVQDEAGADSTVALRQLPVSTVKVVTRGSWGEPFLTTQRLNHYTSDSSAFALCFDAGQAPNGLDGWVLIVEPGKPIVSGDWVVVRHGVGKYSYGRADSSEGGPLGVEVEGRGLIQSAVRRCMLVSMLARQSALATFRACADS